MDNSEDKKQTMDSIVAGLDALKRIFEGYCRTMETLVKKVKQTSGNICKAEASKSSIGAGKGSCAEGGGMASGGSDSKSSYEDVGDVAADDEDSCKKDSVVGDVADVAADDEDNCKNDNVVGDVGDGEGFLEEYIYILSGSASGGGGAGQGYFCNDGNASAVEPSCKNGGVTGDGGADEDSRSDSCIAGDDAKSEGNCKNDAVEGSCKDRDVAAGGEGSCKDPCLHREAIESPPPDYLPKTTMEELLTEAATQETQDPFVTLLSLSQEERNSIMDACYEVGCAPAVAGILEMVRLEVEVDSSVLLAENMTAIEKAIRSHMDNSEDKKQTMNSIVAGLDALNRIFEGYCTTMKMLVEKVKQITNDGGIVGEGGGSESSFQNGSEGVGDVAGDDEDSCKNDNVVSDAGDGEVSCKDGRIAGDGFLVGKIFLLSGSASGSGDASQGYFCIDGGVADEASCKKGGVIGDAGADEDSCNGRGVAGNDGVREGSCKNDVGEGSLKDGNITGFDEVSPKNDGVGGDVGFGEGTTKNDSVGDDDAGIGEGITENDDVAGDAGFGEGSCKNGVVAGEDGSGEGSRKNAGVAGHAGFGEGSCKNGGMAGEDGSSEGSCKNGDMAAGEKGSCKDGGIVGEGGGSGSSFKNGSEAGDRGAGQEIYKNDGEEKDETEEGGSSSDGSGGSESGGDAGGAATSSSINTSDDNPIITPPPTHISEEERDIIRRVFSSDDTEYSDVKTLEEIDGANLLDHLTSNMADSFPQIGFRLELAALELADKEIGEWPVAKMITGLTIVERLFDRYKSVTKLLLKKTKHDLEAFRRDQDGSSSDGGMVMTEKSNLVSSPPMAPKKMKKTKKNREHDSKSKTRPFSRAASHSPSARPTLAPSYDGAGQEIYKNDGEENDEKEEGGSSSDGSGGSESDGDAGGALPIFALPTTPNNKKKTKHDDRLRDVLGLYTDRMTADFSRIEAVLEWAEEECAANRITDGLITSLMEMKNLFDRYKLMITLLLRMIKHDRDTCCWDEEEGSSAGSEGSEISEEYGIAGGAQLQKNNNNNKMMKKKKKKKKRNRIRSSKSKGQPVQSPSAVTSDQDQPPPSSTSIPGESPINTSTVPPPTHLAEEEREVLREALSYAATTLEEIDGPHLLHLFLSWADADVPIILPTLEGFVQNLGEKVIADETILGLTQLESLLDCYKGMTKLLLRKTKHDREALRWEFVCRRRK